MFMIVGVLFQVFGAPIKQIIDKYLGLLTTLFVVLMVGGFIAFTQLASVDDGGEGSDAGEHVCDAATDILSQ